MAQSAVRLPKSKLLRRALRAILVALGLGLVGGLFDTAGEEGGKGRIRRLRFQSGAPDSPLGGGLLRSRFVQ